MARKVFLKRIEVESVNFDEESKPGDGIMNAASLSISAGIEEGFKNWGANRKIDIFDIDDQERKDYRELLEGLLKTFQLPEFKDRFQTTILNFQSLLNKYPQ